MKNNYYKFLTLNPNTGYCEVTKVLSENQIEELNLKFENHK